MNFLQSFRRLFSRKESATQALMVLNVAGRPVGTPRRYDKFAEEGYQKNVIVYACANLIAGACAQIPWLLYEKGTLRKAKRVEIEKHPFFDLVERPNPYMSESEFMQALITYRLLSGQAYVQAVGPNPSMIKELHLWRPDRTKVIPGTNGYPAAYQYEANGGKIEERVDFISGRSPVLHMKRFHPLNDFYGLSPIEAAMLGIDQHNQAGTWNLQLLLNAGMPSGVIQAEASTTNPMATMSQEQRDRLREELKESFQGSRNAGKPLVLEGGLNWKQMSLAPKDMDWLNAKDTSARDIARAFGVPPMLLGIPGDNTYSNYKEANMAFYEQVVLPEMEQIAAWWTHWLLPAIDPARAGKLVVDFDVDQIDAMAPKRAEIWDQTQKAEFLTINEKRERLGYDEIDGGDELLVTSSQVPLSYATQDPQITEQPADPGQDPNDPGSDIPGENEPGVDTSKPDPAGGKAQRAPAGKLFNLKSQRAKAQEWREANRIRIRYEKRLARQLSALFRAEGAEISAQAGKAHDAHTLEAAALAVVDSNRRKFHVVLEQGMRAVGQEFGLRTLEGLKSAPGAPELKDGSIRFNQIFSDWAHGHAGDQVEGVTKTTKKKIKKAVADWQETGDPLDALTSDLEELYSGFEGKRAETIARTEVQTASNQASLRAAEATGIPNLRKEWIFTADKRTRPQHQLSGGEAVVELDGKFSVGGEALEAPGDPAGSPGNIINCRCTVAFLSEGEE
jgi:HK97 family phage portal protein